MLENNPASPSLDFFVKLLGEDVFFVPCELGTKKPRITWKERKVEENRSEAYLSLFEGANIAVRLGKASGGLCALDFDTEEDLETFLAANPSLVATTRSKGARGAMIWLRIIGEFPASVTTDRYEWRADNRLSTIAGRHPSGVNYQLLVSSAPLRIHFDDIIWPEGWPTPRSRAIQQELERKYGPPLHVTDKGAGWISQPFMVAKFRMERDVLWDAVTARFYLYQKDRGLWRHAPDQLLQKMIGDDVRELIGCCKAENNDDARFDPLFKLVNNSFVRGTSEQLRGEALRECIFEKPNRVVHCANGMVDLNESPFSFKAFAKEFYSRNQCPVTFKPGARCDRFINDLLASALTSDDIRLLQNWSGLALLGRNLMQVILILSGTAGGGKGTIANIIQQIIGEANTHQLRSEQLAGRFETSFFHDKTLLYGPDVDADFLNSKSAHVIKALTGNDLLTGEIKFGSQPQNMRGNFNVLVTCNSRMMVRLRGDAEAWSRRLLIIEFTNPPPARRIPEFDRLLIREEGSGILNWMLEGATNVIGCIDRQEPFPLTAAQKARVESLLSESDSVRFFVTNHVQRSPFPLDGVTTEGLFTAYLSICETHGWTPLPQKGFERQSKDLMIQIHRAEPSKHVASDGRENQGKRGYKGVVLVGIDSNRDDEN